MDIEELVLDKAVAHLSSECNLYRAKYSQAKESLDLILEFIGEVNRGPMVTIKSMAEQGLRGKCNEGIERDRLNVLMIWVIGWSSGVGSVFIAAGAWIWLK
jgi:hypothetical protein